MRVHVRCRKCEARRVLPRQPDEYRRQPACACGARDWRPDRWMNHRKTGPTGMGCVCAGYWWPVHRRGAKFCWYRVDGSQRFPGDPDFNDRHMSDEEIAAEAAKREDL